MKNLLALTVLTLCMGQALAAEKSTMITLYNSEATQEGAGATIAVLRQADKKVELFSCTKKYEGSLQDRIAALNFFNEGLSSIFKKRSNCIKYNSIKGAGIDFVVNKRKITGNNGSPIRYVFTSNGSFTELSSVYSDVTTWTVDVNEGNGIPVNSEVFLVGARVSHEKTNNPTISSYRDSYKLSGLAQTLYSNIED